MLGYSALLAAVAGWVNSVALLVWVFPVGNLTALTTKIGMHSTNPLLYSGRMIVVIVLGFVAGVLAAGAVLAAAHSVVGSRQAVVLLAEAALLAAAGIEHPLVRAPLAAAACGLQNGMTSSFPGMAIRTTHVTGTLTDLGLLLGRGHRHKVDRWKAAVLSTTVVLFVGGAAAGVILGARIGDHALIPATLACLGLAVFSVLYDCRRRRRAARAAPGASDVDVIEVR